MFYYIQANNLNIVYRNAKGKVTDFSEVPQDRPVFVVRLNEPMCEETREKMRKCVGLGKKTGYTVVIESKSEFYPMGVLESRLAATRGGTTNLSVSATKIYDCKPSDWLTVIDSTDKNNSFCLVKQDKSGNQYGRSVHTTPVWSENISDETKDLIKKCLKSNSWWAL